MAVKASANITLFHIIDIDSVVIYYLLQSSTANPPAKPTTNPPGGSWTTTEPTYTEGSTDTLYTVTETIYSDGSFEYTPVSKSTAFEAAKAAYNKATNALSANAVIVSSTAPSDTTKIWYDTNTNKFFKYTQTSDDPPTYDWMNIDEDNSEELETIRKDITDARKYAKELADGINETLSDYATVSVVETKISNYDDGIREDFSREINTKTANGNTALTLVNDLKACIERGQDTNGKPFVWLKTGSEDGYKLKIQNDSIVIYKGSTPVSTWLSDKFDVSMVITSTLSLGKFDFIVNNDNSLSFKKVR
jgi:hypothetical protein